MRILFISAELIGSAIVHQLIKEGHNIRLHISHEDRKACFEGFVDKAEDWRSQLEWVGKEGLIVFDDVVFEGVQDELREQGYRVFGGNAASDRLELDRQHFHEILSSHGVPTLPSFDFETADDAIAFLSQNLGFWVVKQSSHIGMLNYVGQRADAKDVLDILSLYKEKGISPVHLQKRVEGIEIAVGRYFNGTDWVGPVEVNQEHKPLCHGNIGPLTAEMGTLMWYGEDEKNPIFSKVLGPLKPYLQEIDYRGDIDINCIANADGIWPLEATMRFGTPATELQCELHNSPWGEFLSAVADGEPYELEYKQGFGLVVSVMLPPFPYAPEVFGNSNIETSTGISLFFKEDLSLPEIDQIHFEEFSKTQRPDGSDRYFVAGKHGYALYVTGLGATIDDARASAYSVVDKIILPKMLYRTDIGVEFDNGGRSALQKWGYIT